MSHLLGQNYSIGLHKYNPAKFSGAVFLDVADAQYNPLNPEEIVAGIHPAKKHGTYGLAKFKGDAVLAEVTTPYKWDSSLEPYIDAEEGLLYVATGTGGVEVQFVEGMAEDLSAFPDGSFDIALSSYAFDYVTDLRRAYDEAWRVLHSPDPTSGKPGGLFVFCLSHPWFQAVGWHLAGDPDEPEVGDYAAWPDVQEWDWTYEDGTTTRMRGHLRTLEQIVNELMEAGFVLERLVEQNIEDVAKASPEELARLPYVSKFDPASQEYQIMRKLPHTLIIRARKGALQYG